VSTLRILHLSLGALTITGFLLRALWMLRRSPLLGRPWVRVVPHVVDTALLASGVGLVMSLGYHLAWPHWLTVKLLALTAYVVLGAIGLRRGRTRGIRVLATLGAIASFAFLVAVALTRSPWPPG
jgi:uncharacterized membrane protein SirB2